jgi:hypothetical protein
MSAKRRNVSLSAQVEARAEQIIKARGFDGLSDMVQTLIREEYERRHPAHVLKEDPAPYGKKISSTTAAAKDLLSASAAGVVHPRAAEAGRSTPTSAPKPDGQHGSKRAATSSKRPPKHDPS